MSVSGALGFSKSSSKSSSSGTRELDVTEVVNKLSEGGRESLDDLIQILGATINDNTAMEMAEAKNKGLTREQALADSAGAVQELMKTSAQNLFPDLFSSQQGAGSYNSTTAQLIADSKQAEAAAKGAAIQVDTIAKYETLSQQNIQNAISQQNTQLQGVLGALGIDADAVSTVTRNEEESGSSTSKGSSTSFSGSVAAGSN